MKYIVILGGFTGIHLLHGLRKELGESLEKEGNMKVIISSSNKGLVFRL